MTINKTSILGERFGPTHFGTMNIDFVRLQMGLKCKILSFIHSLKVKKDLEAIFKFRNEKFKSLF